MNELVYYDEISRSLSTAVYHANANLVNVHGLLRMTIQSRMWERRMETVTGTIVEFGTFEEYVTAKPPHGLGTTIETLKFLCTGDVELLNLIDTASQISPISPEKLPHTRRKVKRFSEEWTVARLVEANRPDLLKNLTSGKLTPYAVQLEMGWRKRTSKA